MKWTDIEVDGVYRNKKGLCRKVLGFTKWVNHERITAKQIEGNDVEYIPCDEFGNPKGTQSHCWYMTFASWAREKLETDGRTPLQRATEYANRLHEMGFIKEANAVQAAFKLYGIRVELPKAIDPNESA